MNQPTDEPKPIVVGDQVRWTQMSIHDKGADIKVRHGTVIAISGSVATVKPRKKQAGTVQVKLAQLEAERKQTAIKAIVDTMMGRNKDE